MNQKQRDFLLTAIGEQHRKEKSELDERRPTAPSLNNYMIAAILDGSFKMKSEKEIRSAIRQRVLELGKDNTLLESSSRSGRGWRDRDDEEDTDMIELVQRHEAESPTRNGRGAIITD